MFKKLLILVLALLFAVLGAVLAINNSQDVTFSLYDLDVTMPLVLLLFAALALGALASLLLASIWLLKQHRQLKKIERSKQLVQKELDNLRSLRGTDQGEHL